MANMASVDTVLDLYTISEKVLVATSSFSLTVSVITEVLLFYIFRSGQVRATRTLRSTLLLVLLVNCIFSASAYLFITVADPPTTNWEFTGPATSQMLCLLVFGLSTTLLVSAWRDFRDEKSLAELGLELEFGEKGNIHI